LRHASLHPVWRSERLRGSIFAPVSRTARSGIYEYHRRMRDVYILAAARTPIGKFGGGLSTTPATELGSIAIRAAVER